MARREKLKPGDQQTRKRLRATQFFFALLFLLLIGGLFYRQIIDGPRMRSKALSQWTRTVSLTARRGDITDANGVVLATSSSSVTVVAVPETIKAYAEKTGASLKEIADSIVAVTGGDAEQIAERMADTTRRQVVVARQIRLDVAQQVRALGIKGLDYQDDQIRAYPQGDLACQLLGYTDISLQGQSGLERTLDKYLRGTNGKIVASTDSRGRLLTDESIVYQDPVDGNNVVLTINYVLQSLVQEITKECFEKSEARSVQALMINVKTGEILADCTYPCFDLNSPPRSNLDALNRMSKHSTMSESYTPGAGFEIITLAAALENGCLPGEAEYRCAGGMMNGTQKVVCWETDHPHGEQTIIDAFENSCEPAFAQVMSRFTRDVLYGLLDKLGFGRTLNPSLPGVSAGNLKSVKYVTRQDLSAMGYGEGIQSTPLQMLTASAALVNDGKVMKPFVIKRISDAQGNTVLENTPETIAENVVSAETSAQIRAALKQAVKEGTAMNAYVPGFQIGGKTSLVIRKTEEDEEETTEEYSFIGFAPAEDPEIGLILLVKDPNVKMDYAGTVVAPYAGRILEQSLLTLGYKPKFEDGEQQSRDATVQIPDLNGHTLDEAKEMLETDGIRYVVIGSGDRVTGQLPAAAATVRSPSLMVLFAEKEEQPGDGEEAMEEEMVMPDLQGRSMTEVGRILRCMGLKMSIHGVGTCDSQSIQAGTKVKKDTSVSVHFS